MIIVCENNSLSGMRAAGASDAWILYTHTTTMNYAGGGDILNNKRTHSPLYAFRQSVYLITQKGRLGGRPTDPYDRRLMCDKRCVLSTAVTLKGSILFVFILCSFYFLHNKPCFSTTVLSTPGRGLERFYNHLRAVYNGRACVLLAKLHVTWYLVQPCVWRFRGIITNNN